jgi:hypothetical protein
MFVPHSLLSYLHVYFGHITHHSGTQISTVFGYNFPLAHKRAFVTFGDFAYFLRQCRFHLSLLFSPLQEDNVAIAIAMNGINIFHEYDLIYLLFFTIET